MLSPSSNASIRPLQREWLHDDDNDDDENMMMMMMMMMTTVMKSRWLLHGAIYNNLSGSRTSGTLALR